MGKLIDEALEMLDKLDSTSFGEEARDLLDKAGIWSDSDILEYLRSHHLVKAYECTYYSYYDKEYDEYIGNDLDDIGIADMVLKTVDISELKAELICGGLLEDE
jgi:hypothetical protein